MKVLLINVCLRPESPKIIFPIGLGYIATAINKAGFEMELLDIDAYRYTDDQVKEMLKEKQYDVAAFGCIVTGYRIAKKLAATIKECRDVPVIAGNSVASSITEILLKKTKVDIAVIGEGDVTIVELLKALENNSPLSLVDGIAFSEDGKVVYTRKREPIADLDTIPFIKWDLFNMDIYISKSRHYVDEPYAIDFDKIKAMPVNTARGCAYKCTFCYHVFRDVRYRVRSVEKICDEIALLKQKYGLNYINFWDELTLYSKKQSIEFVDTILKRNLGIYWIAVCRSGLFDENDLSLLKKFKEAGCRGLGYSLESANREILKAMNKKTKPEEYSRQVQVIRKAGISNYTSIVIGYPQETSQTIKETFDCCYENDVYPSTGYLLPQPGGLRCMIMH